MKRHTNIITRIREYCCNNSYEVKRGEREKLIEDLNMHIEMGCDVNESDDVGLTPLHAAAVHCLGDVIDILIKAGADVNMHDNFFEQSPLYLAVNTGNVEIVCQLLYYGSDVSIQHRDGMTALMHAIHEEEWEIAEILIDYYDDFSDTDVFSNNALILAASKRSSLAVQLVLRGADVVVGTSFKYSPLGSSLFYHNAELFKLIWAKEGKKEDLFLSGESFRVPFLSTYLLECCFSPSEWIECLCTLLSSEIAFDLVNEIIIYMNRIPGHKQCFLSLFIDILQAFDRRKIELTDRMTVLYLCLTLGVKASFDDIITAYKYYGFNEELTALMYVYDNDNKYREYNYLLPTFILVQEVDINSHVIFEILKQQILFTLDILDQELVINTLNYVSLPIDSKRQLINLCVDCFAGQKYGKEICEKIKLVPEMPSLLELARNEARKAIKLYYKFEKPYQFHHAVNNLYLPQSIKDIICFKMPLYN